MGVVVGGVDTPLVPGPGDVMVPLLALELEPVVFEKLDTYSLGGLWY